MLKIYSKKLEKTPLTNKKGNTSSSRKMLTETNDTDSKSFIKGTTYYNMKKN